MMNHKHRKSWISMIALVLAMTLLPLGAMTMTMECGVRFLTDYLDGDRYFATNRPGQNLDRCRTQFKLYADMREKEREMHEAVRGEL